MQKWIRWLPLFSLLVLAAGPARAADPDEAAPAGYLGILLQRVQGGLAEALDLKEDAGVLVSQVVEDSPAAQAGLQAGDIVTRIDDSEVGTPAELRRVVRDHHAGDRVKVHYLRDGKKGEADVTLGDAESDDATGPTFRMGPGKMHGFRSHGRELRIHGERGFLGVSTQPLTGDLGTYFGVKDGKGALVAHVEEDSPAAKLGLKAGDVIVKVADKDIDGPGELSDVIRSYEEAATVEVSWIRDRKEKSGKVELELRESGPMSWFDAPMIGNLDFDRDDLRFADPDLPGVERRVRIERRGNVDKELKELREQLDDLRQQIEEMRGPE